MAKRLLPTQHYQQDVAGAGPACGHGELWCSFAGEMNRTPFPGCCARCQLSAHGSQAILEVLFSGWHRKVIMITKFVAAVVVLSGGLGLVAQLYVGIFGGARGSIDSPHWPTRIIFRYLLFWPCLLMSFLLSPLVLSPLVTRLDFSAIRESSTLGWLVYLSASFPIAVILFMLYCKYMRWADRKKFGLRR